MGSPGGPYDMPRLLRGKRWELSPEVVALKKQMDRQNLKESLKVIVGTPIENRKAP